MTRTLNPDLLPDSGTPENVAPGWRRVVRARDAAYARPKTHGKQYFERLELAEWFNSKDINPRASLNHWSQKVEFYVCSDFCAVFQYQVGHSPTQTYDDAQRSLEGGRNRYVAFPLAPNRTRKFTCFVCRRIVFKDNTFDDTYRINFRDPNQPLIVPPKAAPKAKPETSVQPWHGVKREDFGIIPPSYNPVKHTPLTDWERDLLNETHTWYVNTTTGERARKEPKFTKVVLTNEESILFGMLGETAQREYMKHRANS